MNMHTPKWRARFLEVAATVAKWSKDPTTKVGCVIISPKGLIISTGYNGIPRGVEDKPERMERPAKYLFLSHAEQSAIANAARHGSKTEGATMFVTHQPCSHCARQIINAGIVAVVCGDGTTSMPHEEFVASRQMLHEAGVSLICEAG